MFLFQDSSSAKKKGKGKKKGKKTRKGKKSKKGKKETKQQRVKRQQREKEQAEKEEQREEEKARKAAYAQAKKAPGPQCQFCRVDNAALGAQCTCKLGTSCNICNGVARSLGKPGLYS